MSFSGSVHVHIKKVFCLLTPLQHNSDHMDREDVMTKRGAVSITTEYYCRWMLCTFQSLYLWTLLFISDVEI